MVLRIPAFVPLFILTFCALSHTQENNYTITSPRLLKPSGYWDGPDGPWASYNITVGDDGAASPFTQIFRTFPGLSLSFTLLPMTADFCSKNNTPACQARGAFQSNLSRGWKQAGEIGISSALGLSGFLDNDNSPLPYGTDNIGFGQGPGPSYQDFILAAIPIAGVASKELFMGLFGLSPTPLEFGGHPINTYYSNFREFNNTPSLSFSYTAGSYGKNRTPPSLVFGGYDATRFDPKDTLLFDIRNTSVADPYEFGVTIDSISIVSEKRPELKSSVSLDVPAYVYSVVPEIRLPLDVCRAFEQKLGLKWDKSANLYLLQPHERARLLEASPEMVIKVSSTRNVIRKDRSFTLPFSALNLLADYPLVEKQTAYFPLKCSSAGPFLLGRTFLQEVYLSVDYERRYFNLSQAIYAKDKPPDIKTIMPLELPPDKERSHPAKPLSRGGYAGVGLGVGTFLVAIGLLILAFIKQWRPFRKRKQDPENGYEKPELGGKLVPRIQGKSEAMEREMAELETVELRSEAMSKERIELETREPRLELIAGMGEPIVIPGLNELHEMDARSMKSDATERGGVPGDV